jgi:hypothetical protein
LPFSIYTFIFLSVLKFNTIFYWPALKYTIEKSPDPVEANPALVALIEYIIAVV